MTPYRNTRPASPKGRVYSVFASDGEVKAMEFGQTLKLPVTKLQRWFNTWAGRTAADPNGKVPPRELTSHSPRVRVKWDPEAETVLATEGPEVSTIKWLKPSNDYMPVGYTQYIPNTQWSRITARPKVKSKPGG